MTWTFTLTRRMRLALEAILVLGMLMCVAFGWGLWHLSQGPINLKPVLPFLTRTFDSWLPGMDFSIQDASLEWGGRENPLTLRVKDIDLKSPRGRTIGKMDEVTIGLAPQALIVGQIAPTTIDIRNPSLTVTRYPDGRIAFRFDHRDETETESELNWRESLHALRTDHYVFTAFLRRIMVSNLTVRYRDFMTRRNMIHEDGRLLIERNAQNALEGQALFYIPVGDSLEPITMDIYPDKKRPVSIGTARFPAVTVQQIAQWFPHQTILQQSSGTLTSELVLEISKQHRIGAVEWHTRSEDLVLVDPTLFPEPVPVSSTHIGLRYDSVDKSLTLSDTHIKLPHTTLQLQARLDDPFRSDYAAHESMLIEGQASLTDLPIDELYRYWPLPVADDAREWVTTSIKDGTATHANANFTLTLPRKAMDTKSFDQFVLEDLHGEITYKDLTTDYLPPMLPVKDISGTINYTAEEFVIHPKSGTIRDTHVSDGTITIAPLTLDPDKDTFLTLDLKMKGDIQDALVLLASEPVKFTQELGIDPQQVSGSGSTDLHLHFPLHDDLDLDEITVKATSKLHSATVRDAYKNAALNGTDLDLTVNNDGLLLQGAARLSDAPLEHLTWTESFDDKSALKREFKIKGTATPQLLNDLGLGVSDYFKDRAALNAHITETHQGDTKVTLDADLTAARIAVPALSVDKRAGQKGTLSFVLDAPAKGQAVMHDIALSMPSLSTHKARITFADDQSLHHISIPDLKAGRSAVSINATALPRNKGWQASVNGSILDLSGSSDETEKTSGNSASSFPPIKLDLKIANLYLDKNMPLKNMNGTFFVDQDVILQADFTARAHDTLMTMRFSPDKDGNRILRFEANNAGYAMQALGLTDTMRGGTISITGGSQAATPQQIRGTITLESFSLIKAPLLARLLNAFSLGGMLDLLNQKGLVFHKLTSDFIHQDKQLILRKGRMAGSSLGLNFSGTINQKTGKMDMHGTIVPVQGINKLASNIPLFGRILTGLKGEGLVAATYTIKGDTSHPSVMVNPLSVLTPGILRSIFFEQHEN
jgi:hypothetical protein